MSTISEAVGKNLDLSVNEPLKELVYKAFRKTIILGEIPAGQRINEKEFSEVMNISRTPIRYALQKLVEEGLVDHVRGVGIIVRGISLNDANEIYAIRKSLDVLATITAMKEMDSEDFEELKTLLEETERLNEANEIDQVLQKFSDFNELIYEKSKMLRLKSIVMKLREYLVYFRDISIRSKDRRDKALNEHWLIYKCMLNQEEEQLKLLITEHLDYSQTFILKEMEKHLNETAK
ncbi:GntR family transcriptional regulator [Enterococcus haemoperoxidus ATCC BAA-382]|uniref:GntR family transcriptional regulator n=1 Tax=Enterococcus haemoperoxidus ATCC BAA-382 TaxID=1158608 RepID=R2T3D9_9ENTE|nr:GntR family transcriptional regulator [Enterococcus haemoperoxidus]EOH99501.1 GntR family transcriptional regulator [Enterococcus haemoperoxidus ATCC BAA-382]EOT62759.1 GntR family transcriptional regulator [Enterococcus haemoperoxidus ATCC BAA-382]OJG55227.1 GntR family transcriptional regulator [Enterococcus haemoperoxidus]